VVGIVEGRGQRIAEDGRSFGEGDVVLLQIGGGLLGVLAQLRQLPTKLR
jgi:hypothetical protein